ncbi:MAG: hypothetical protein ACOYOF_12515, partial [Verrucomicrobiaceae bacterium]
IGWKQFHDAFTSRGSLGPDNKYTAGPLAGMDESQAKAWTQREWQRHGDAGTQSAMANKLATVYGTRKESPAMGSPAAPTSPQSQKSVMAPASQRSGPVTMPGTQMLQKMGIQPVPSGQLPGSGVLAKPSMPTAKPVNNDPALTARVRAQGGDATATVWDNGKPWRPGMSTPTTTTTAPMQSAPMQSAPMQSAPMPPTTNPVAAAPTHLTKPDSAAPPVPLAPPSLSDPGASLLRQRSIATAPTTQPTVLPMPVRRPRPTDQQPQPAGVATLSPQDSTALNSLNSQASFGVPAISALTSLPQGRDSSLPAAARAATGTPASYPHTGSGGLYAQVWNRVAKDNAALKAGLKSGAVINASQKDKKGGITPRYQVRTPAKLDNNDPASMVTRALPVPRLAPQIDVVTGQPIWR